MVTIRNARIEERHPEMSNIGAQFLAQMLDAPVGIPVPNVPLGTATSGYAVHYLSRTECVLPVRKTPQNPVPCAFSPSFSLAMTALHVAFAEHVPFTFSPEMAWYLIAHEIAVHIRLNAERYRGYFTASADKDLLEVRDDSLVYGSSTNDWGRAINLIRDPLAAKVPKPTLDLMLPKFSTASFETETSLLILFLEIASNYYQFIFYTHCGVPAVQVEGTAEDWRTVVQHTDMARSTFPNLKPYFDDLLPVLDEIAGTVSGDEPDPEFWSSIYKLDQVSGGPYINGWITAFFAYGMERAYLDNRRLTIRIPRPLFDWRSNNRASCLTTRDFPTHFSTVPFVWDYYGKVIDMAFIAGVMGVEYDGFLTPRLGYGVLEKSDN